MDFITKLIGSFFGNKSEKDIQGIQPRVDEINKIFFELQKLSNDELRSETGKLRIIIAEKLKTHPRPVGNVCRKNSIQLLIPCHRIIGKNNIGGFSGEDIATNGDMIFIKKNLLSFERI